MTTRKTYRAHIGRALGRKYWDLSTVVTNSTAEKLLDPKRTEYPAFWDGAYVKIGTEEVQVRRGGGSINTGTGMLYLDRALAAGAPSNGTEYEVIKGWTFADLDEAMDFAFGGSYPEFYLPVIDITTVVEVANTLSYALPATWRLVVSAEREQIRGQTPSWYTALYEGRDYRIGMNGSGQMTFEPFFTPEAGRKVRLRAKATPSLATTDAGAGTPDIPWEVITPGALHYLYDKGINADESASALNQRFSEEAARQLAIFEQKKTLHRMKTSVRRAGFPILSERSDGLSVLH